MTVYIAEKPDIARAMASYLWGGEARGDGHCFRKGDTMVTWAYGHILEMAPPADYGKEYADFRKYPVFPAAWKKRPSPSAREQLDFIRAALKEADVVVNGGDPDREGQLLVDEILEHAGYKGETRRILVNAKDEASMRRAFDGIAPNSKFRGLYLAGLARERADWLVGMNLSRAYTAAAGDGSAWRIGRVKTPTLALVVNREKEIRDFRPSDYHELSGRYSKEGTPFTATLKVPGDAPADGEGRVTDRSYLEAIREEVAGRPATVTLHERKAQAENPPLPYSLDTLQVEADRRFGMPPSDVLATVQSLYEKRYVSYPRSDCNHVPAAQHGDGRAILEALAGYGIDAGKVADAAVKGRCFDDGKVGAHHAIIPTGVVPEGLGERESKIYGMIARRYVLQFCPPCRYDAVRYEITSEGHVFAGSGKAVSDPGWRGAFRQGEDDGEKPPASVPPLEDGETLPAPEYSIESKTTSPPKRFTEGTLLAAMTNIWRFVSPDNPAREKLKECKGIGTPATRGGIISDLLAAKAGKPDAVPCIRKKGRELVPTPFGTAMIGSVHESLARPDMTAAMECDLSAIAEGRMGLEEFMEETAAMVRRNIAHAESSARAHAGGREALSAECPVCRRGTLVRRYSPKTKRHFWVCGDKSCVHPATGRTVFHGDDGGRPDVRACPGCGLPLSSVWSAKTKRSYWHCDKCGKFVNQGTQGTRTGRKGYGRGKGS